MKFSKVKVPIMCLLLILLFGGQNVVASTAKSTVGITFEGTAGTTVSSSDTQTSNATEGSTKTRTGTLPKTGEVNHQLGIYGLLLSFGVFLIWMFKKKGREE